MTEEENAAESGAQPANAPQSAPGEPVCAACGLPLRVLRGGMKIEGGGIVSVAVLGCPGAGGGPPCPLAGQEQARLENPVALFES